MLAKHQNQRIFQQNDASRIKESDAAIFISIPITFVPIDWGNQDYCNIYRTK